MKSLEGQRLCFHYESRIEEKDYDYFFAGQYNEEGIWDGKCLINRYYNGKFDMASEEIYKDGKKISYVQIYAGENDWVYGARIVEDNGLHSGDTFEYTLTDSAKQVVKNNMPLEEKMFTPNDYRDSLGESPRLWYHGTTNGKNFSDVTGKAFQIVYHPDGTVKTFYIGNFGEGSVFGWELAKEQEDWDHYDSYLGVFSDNQHEYNDDLEKQEQYYSKKEIIEKLKSKEITGLNLYDLKWGKLRDD